MDYVNWNKRQKNKIFCEQNGWANCDVRHYKSPKGIKWSIRGWGYPSKDSNCLAIIYNTDNRTNHVPTDFYDNSVFSINGKDPTYYVYNGKTYKCPQDFNLIVVKKVVI